MTAGAECAIAAGDAAAEGGLVSFGGGGGTPATRLDGVTEAAVEAGAGAAEEVFLSPFRAPMAPLGKSIWNMASSSSGISNRVEDTKIFEPGMFAAAEALDGVPVGVLGV